MLLRVLSPLLFLSLLVFGTAFAQTTISAGSDYKVLNPPQPTDSDTIEVLEFFAYGCIHCYTLEAKLEPWVKQLPKDVKFQRVPTPFKIRGIDSVPIFYTLEAMDLLGKLHVKLFEAIHNENLIVANPAVLTQWLTKQGVDMKKYQDIEKSFSVQSKISRARILTEGYKIESTPTLALGGKYLVASQPVADRTFQIADAVIAMARLSKSGAPKR